MGPRHKKSSQISMVSLSGTFVKRLNRSKDTKYSVSILGCNNTSPISHTRLSVLNNYEQLKNNLKNVKEKITETGGQWDAMKFLFQFRRLFYIFEENRIFTKLKYHSLNNARWNSRVILSLLTYFLLPEKRYSLLEICRFISHRWADHLFTVETYNADSYQKLCSSLKANKKY